MIKLPASLSAVGGIDPCGHPAREHGGEVGHEPLGRVEADDADAVARGQTELDEAAGGRANLNRERDVSREIEKSKKSLQRSFQTL